MARIRSIKPEFFQSEDVASLSLRARLTWLGIWTQVDDHGRMKDNARVIKGAVWPLDDNIKASHVETDLEALAEQGAILRYEVDGTRYLQVSNWTKHQVINRPSGAKCPPPEGDSVMAHGGLTEDSLKAHGGKGREGKGNGKEGTRESVPEAKCDKHRLTDKPPPCRACGDARRAYDAWIIAEKNKPTPTPDPYVPEHIDLADENARGVALHAIRGTIRGGAA